MLDLNHRFLYPFMYLNLQNPYPFVHLKPETGTPFRWNLPYGPLYGVPPLPPPALLGAVMGYLSRQDGAILPAQDYLLCSRNKCVLSQYNKTFIDQACSVKMAGYRPCSFVFL